ncbi:Gx transporter family protein [Agathobacter sp.]
MDRIKTNNINIKNLNTKNKNTKNSMNTTGMSRKIAYGAMLVALAMIFSYVESLIPISIGIPGIKLGIANLVTVMGIYFLRPADVFIVVIMRIVLVGFMFGNGVSIIYSLAGGILSFVIMLLIKKTDKFSVISVSVVGGITHNLGQITIAAILLKSTAVIYYLPVLMIAGTVTGLLIGIVAEKVFPAVGISGKNFLHKG